MSRTQATWQKPLRWWAPWRVWAVRREWRRQYQIVAVNGTRRAQR